MMNHSTRVIPEPRRASSSAAQTAAAIIATAGLALLAAACGGSPSSTGSGGSSSAGGSSTFLSAVGYTRCMRSHGVPNFPDPGSNGEIRKGTAQQLGVSTSVLQAASQTCGHLLPHSDTGRTAAATQQEWSGMLNFARCMRSHGVPNWPDPTHYPPRPTDPTFNLPASIQPIPQITSKMQECLRLVPDNAVVGHIDNDNWAAWQQQMAGQ
jgi:hypothetical protein